jgi:subtilisin-like proprotein convertase family protein
VVAILAILIALPVPLHAQPNCGTTTVNAFHQEQFDIPDPGNVSTTMDLSGLPTSIVDINVTTFITHTDNGHLNVTLTSPDGTEVSLTTGNGVGLRDVFSGTTWDDDAGDTNPPGPVTDNAMVTFILETPLAPEEAMGAFLGENPNGIWTLTLVDDVAGVAGYITIWAIEVTATSQTVIEETTSLGNNSPGPITNFIPLISAINVVGLGSFIWDVDLRTNISHTANGDLNVTLTSPAGTEVTITSGNGADLDDIFAGTIWDDDAGDSNPPGPVTDNALADLVAESALVPEEAMAAFFGEDPNGIWTLEIFDGLDGPNTGTLNGWSLTITTARCTALPVELFAFEAGTEGDDVSLRWTTASETNNSGFEVQRKMDGEGASWESLGFVAGAGTTDKEQSYSYRATDLGPGMHRFRLKQIDLDGAYDYSPEVEAQIGVAGTHSLGTAYPNPFNPSTVFTLVVGDTQPVLVEVYDQTGKRVALLHEGLLEADTRHQFRIEAGQLASGVYIYRATGRSFADSRAALLMK